MVYYYAEASRQVGPLTEEQFFEAVQQGVIEDETLVWREDMPKWQALRTTSFSSRVAAFKSLTTRCATGSELSPPPVLAGFGIRAAAYIVDSLILTGGNLLIHSLAGLFLPLGEIARVDLALLLWIYLGLVLAQLAIACAYETWFVGRHGATPGKLLCAIKVVRGDGAPVTYGHAWGRFCAKFLGTLPLGLGLIIAAFDHENRALHDMLCDTRVVERK